ncbi:MAG: hypothetical protein BWK76_26935 [Desulfobulbaceae bacterium A2]|nr:MAG: hypothetical protein BWK76_26935 [Desulfobulbaceae bacterium A2]
MPQTDLTIAPPDTVTPQSEERLLVVDDFEGLLAILQAALIQQDFLVVTATSAAGARKVLHDTSIALVLLDIGLPDASGMDLIGEFKALYPDTAVVMLTAQTDLETALSCLRLGAADFLAKPVDIDLLLATVRRVLEKRLLRMENRRYQRQLELASFRAHFLHELVLEMNTVYLSASELDQVLQAVLVGITAAEGLQFHRAFIALFDDQHRELSGRLALGPDKREDAGRIWRNLKEQNFTLRDILANIQQQQRDVTANSIVHQLRVASSATDHLLIRAAQERRSFNVIDGQVMGEEGCRVPADLLELLGETSFVVVPLYAPARSLGVLIADHFVTHEPISAELLADLQIFAAQASLAIEHSRLYTSMQRKIGELVALANELEKNKDLLVKAERTAALGQMASQLAHALRNPITSIGGTARLLSRKTDNPEWLKFLNMMAKEATRVEATLNDIYTFVEHGPPQKQRQPLGPLVRKALMLFYGTMQRQEIQHELLLASPEPDLALDGDQIKEMLAHLLHNAMEAMPDGGQLTVTTSVEEGGMGILMRDSGVGLADAILDRATEPFFTTKTYGTGLGLAMAERIAKDHGGSLALAPHTGGGTEARIFLPLP